MARFSHSLIVPRVNLNGSPKERLVKQLLKCSNALYAASMAMGEAVPHGRDFQTFGGDDAAQEARKAWDERRKAVDQIRKEVESLAMSIERQ